MIVYLIQNLVNNKGYVGKTTKSLDERWFWHFYGRQPIGRAIRKYGKENFRLSVLERADSLEELNVLERFQIAQLKTLAPNGYNLTPGGDGVTRHLPEALAKMSAASKGRIKSKAERARLSASLKGRIHSAESRAKMSAAQGKVFSAERRAQMSIARKGKPGKPISEAQRAKISATLKGRVKSPEHQAKITAALKGRTMPDGWREKLSASLKGRTFPHMFNPKGPMSEERKAQISAARKGKIFSEEHREHLRLAWEKRRQHAA